MCRPGGQGGERGENQLHRLRQRLTSEVAGQRLWWWRVKFVGSIWPGGELEESDDDSDLDTDEGSDVDSDDSESDSDDDVSLEEYHLPRGRCSVNLAWLRFDIRESSEGSPDHDGVAEHHMALMTMLVVMLVAVMRNCRYVRAMRRHGMHTEAQMLAEEDDIEQAEARMLAEAVRRSLAESTGGRRSSSSTGPSDAGGIDLTLSDSDTSSTTSDDADDY
jgi:hypothetical protein